VVQRPIPGAEAIDPPLSASVVTLGTFDGVHLGHRRLVERALASAPPGVPTIAYTFDPHPAKLLAPSRAPALLVSTATRIRLLYGLGVDEVILEPFDARFAALEADDWVERYLVGRLHPRRVVVGFNFTYGRGRGGDPQHLARAGSRHGFEVDVVEPVELDGDVVSSSRIRALLVAGEVRAAARLLGRSYSLTGSVVEGERRGRTLGFPTANLATREELLPARGVYATRLVHPDGRRLAAVTNIGSRPTFGGVRDSVETHVLGFAEDLYGLEVEIELEARLREERRFDGIDALVRQIHEDVRAAERALA